MRILRLFLSRTIIFFVGIFMLIFLGDDRQGAVDIAAVALLLILYLIDFISGAQHKKPNNTISRLWTIALVSMAVMLFFSDSPGYSVTSIIRYAIAYMSFAHFAFSQKETSISSYMHGLVGFSSLCILFSFFLFVFPRFGAFLPGMNLLYPVYGHNHIVDIIFFVLPFLVAEIVRIRTLKNLLLFLAMSGAFVFSRARGAVVVLIGYGAWFLYALQRRAHSAPPLVIIVCLAAVLFLGTMLLPMAVPPSLVKGGMFQSRFAYWNQATKSFIQKPVFGSGPGTFYLSSRKFQDSPSTASWYAHSFPLQTLSETGLFGLFVVMALFGYPLLVVQKSIRQKSSSDTGASLLLQALCLVLLYSFFEMLFDFLVVWMLFWATLGVLYRHAVPHEEGPKHSKGVSLTTVLVVVLGIYYVLTVLATGFSTILKDYRAAYLFQPHIVTGALDYLRQESEKHRYNIGVPEGLMGFFHKNDPEVAYALGQHARDADKNAAGAWYARAVGNDLYNQTYAYSYIKYLAAELPSPEAGKSLLHILRSLNRVRKDSPLFSLDDVDRRLGAALKRVYLHLDPHWNEGYVSVSYVLAMEIMDTDPQLTEALLLFARDIYPDVGFVHVDLVRYYLQVANNSEKARKAIEYCISLASPKKQCEEESWRRVPPGDFLYLFI